MLFAPLEVGKTIFLERMMAQEALIFDRALLAHRRRRAAAGASQYDFLLRRVADDLCDRLRIVQRDFPVVLSMSALPGLMASRLSDLDKIRCVISTDAVDTRVPLPSGLAEGLDVAADEEALPFAEASLDAIVSALRLQFVNDVPGCLIQMRRALKPDGLLLAALMGGDTLKELREAWLVAEEEVCGGASPRVAPFADVRAVGGLLQRAGFALPVVDSDTVTVTYATALDLMRDIKGMGGSNPLILRRRVPVTRGLLMRVCEVYAERFALPGGRVPATFEIISLTAWVPHEMQPKPLRPGSAQMRLSDVLKPKDGTG